jgi:F-type H+-transporting ATPase subunit b
MAGVLGSTVAFQIVNFLVLLAVLDRALYRPALKRMEARRREIHEALDAAERARAEGREAARAIQAELDALRDDMAREREESLRRATRLKSELEAQAHEDVRRWRAQAERAIAHDRTAALARLQSDLGTVVAEGLRAVLADVRGPSLQAVFVRAFVERLAGLEAAKRARFAGGYELETAVALDEGELAELERALGGRPARVRVEPGLLMGLRVRVGDFELDGSLARAIERLAERGGRREGGDGTERTSA